jgi:hypothetical protein
MATGLAPMHTHSSTPSPDLRAFTPQGAPQLSIVVTLVAAVALIVVVSITATAATVTPITADVVVAAPVSSPQVVDDPERDLRAGGSIDIGGAREVEDEAAVAQVSVGAKPIPGDMRPWASVVPCPRNRLPVAAPFPACKVTYWRATV